MPYKKGQYFRPVDGCAPEEEYKGANMSWCKKNKCKYFERANGTASCGYLLATGKRRPCPAGPGCTALAPSTGRKSWSIY